jgi:hypothetical protein
MNVIIDRFEGEYAIVIYNNKSYNIPRILVGNASEGDVITITINKEETNNRKKIIEDKMASLFKD